ncbi:MAG: hypothetical protein JXQ96_23660 [Cyclobacteriaceae bacterium]
MEIERQYYTQNQACNEIGICRKTLRKIIKKHKGSKRLQGSKLSKKIVEYLKNVYYSNLYGFDVSDYDLDEEGNIISCCGHIVDPDVMRCPECKENA